MEVQKSEKCQHCAVFDAVSVASVPVELGALNVLVEPSRQLGLYC